MPHRRPGVMMIRPLILLTCLLSLLSLALPAADIIPGAASGLPRDTNVVWGRLDNGVRYAVMPNDQPKDKVSLRLLVTAGSLVEDDVQLGLAHYLEHLAFNGTTHYPPGTLVTQLQALGLSFGADTNAHTSFDETVYKLDLPDTKTATIATGLRVLGDYAGGMLLVPAEIDRERGIILAEMRDRNTPSFREIQALYRTMYVGKRIGNRFPIGVPETINAAERKHLMQFYTDWYRPERLVVIAVGAITPDAVVTQIRDVFSMLSSERPARAEPDYGTLTPAELAVCLHHETEAEGTTVSLMRLIQRQQPVDSLAYRTRDLLGDIADQIVSQRLRKYIAAHPNGALLEAGAHSYQWLDVFHAGVQGKARPGQALAALAIIEQEVRRMVEHGPTAGELASTVATFVSGYEEAVAKAGNRTNASLATMLTRAAKLDQAVLNPSQEHDVMVPVLKKANVTEVGAIFRANWSSGNLLASVTGAEDLGTDGERQVRAAMKASQAVAVEAPKQADIAAWGYGSRPEFAPLSAAEEAERKRKVEVFAKRDITLDVVGPIDVVVRRTTYKPNEVLVQARLALPLEPRPAGWSELVSRAFLAGGLGKHPAEDLAEVLAGKSARMSSPRFDEDSVVFSGSCLPKDLELCLQRLTAQISDPGWRSEAETRAKAEWRDELVALASNLDQQVSRRFQSLVVHDEPHRRPATAAEAEMCSFAVVRPWFDQLLATAPMQITVVGDIDENEVLALVRPYAALLGKRRAAAAPHLGAPQEMVLAKTQPMPAGVHRFAVPGTVRRALIRIAWPTTDYYDVGRTRRLGMLAQVIDELMRVRIREELGDAYSPFSYRFASETYAGHGFLLAQVGVAPEKAEIARAAMLEIATTLVSNGVDAELLERVRQPIIKSLATQRQQNQYWLGSVYDRAAVQPFRRAWADSLESDYSAMTAAELTELAKQYLINDKALQVIGVCEGQ